MKRLAIGVIGNSITSEEEYIIAEKVGSFLAERNCILICGGLGGVMEAAAKGAKSKGGKTVGIIPDSNKMNSNQFIDIPIATGIGEARNVIIVNSSDSIIAIGGSFGTLSEISFALKKNIPIVGINTWNVSDKIVNCADPKIAVETAINLINPNRDNLL